MAFVANTLSGAFGKCSDCGTAYERITQSIPVRDKDSADCDVCGSELESWNAAVIIEFRLVTAP